MTGDERTAARSGVGAVMGSKKLKAVVVEKSANGKKVRSEQFKQLRKATLDHLKEVENKPFLNMVSGRGTCQAPAVTVPSGVVPIRNWSLLGVEAYPDPELISGENITRFQIKKRGCSNCPVNCGGTVKLEKAPYANRGRKPEYETQASFGTLLMNHNVESIIKANDVCDDAGIDTISRTLKTLEKYGIVELTKNQGKLVPKVMATDFRVEFGLHYSSPVPT